MNVNILEVIVLVMVVTIVVTITLAAMSYGAFRVRERRRPATAEEEREGPMFFERVRLPGLVERGEPRAAGGLRLGLEAVGPVGPRSAGAHSVEDAGAGHPAEVRSVGQSAEDGRGRGGDEDQSRQLGGSAEIASSGPGTETDRGGGGAGRGTD